MKPEQVSLGPVPVEQVLDKDKELKKINESSEFNEWILYENENATTEEQKEDVSFKKVVPDKLRFIDVKNQIDEDYFELNDKYSTSLDILATFEVNWLLLILPSGHTDL